MGLDWLWQGVVGNLVAAVLILAGGTMLAYLRAKNPRWFGVILYGLVGSSLVAVIWIAFIGIIILSKQPTQTTLENVEPYIRAWMDRFSLTVQKEVDQSSHFSYRVIIPQNINVSLKRTKAHDRYITIETGVNISPEDQPIQSIIAKLSEEQSRHVRNELILEMARLNVQWNVSTLPLKDILLLKLVPITSNLTEDVFFTHLIEMGNAVFVARASIIRAVTYTRQSP
jgi:hypothetical protein